MPQPEQIEAAARYALEILLGADARGLIERGEIAYGPHLRREGDANAKLSIIPSGFFGEDYGRPRSAPKTPLTEIEGAPLLYGEPRLERDGDTLTVHADLIASTFFLVTRYEEMIKPDVRDVHGRYPGRRSLAWWSGFIDRPIVDEYGALLRRWLAEAGIEVEPPRRKFSILLTHDVDSIRKHRNPIRTAAAALTGRRPAGDIPESLRLWAGLGAEPFDAALAETMRLDRELAEKFPGAEVRSAYFFIAGGRTRYDGRYDIGSPQAGRVLRAVQDSGASVGLHASYSAGLSPELIGEEKASLERAAGCAVRENRHHYLAWREVADGWGMAKAGITSDCTMGYADVAGFRLGVCRPIPLFDPVRFEPFGIEERPLVVMDATLSNPQYEALGEQEAFDRVMKLAGRVRRHNGELTLLWHVDRLMPAPNNYHPSLYPRILAALAEGS